MNIKKYWMIAGIALLTALGASADPISISITGTADSTAMGYTSGQSYTFTWTLNDGYTGGSGDNFVSSYNQWAVGNTSDPILWTSVSGDGLSGTYSRPSGSPTAPNDFLYGANGDFELYAANDDLSGSSMGLTVNGVNLRDVYLYSTTIPGLDCTATSYIDPVTWMSGYANTYNSPGGTLEVSDINSSTITFTPTSATIAAIPEPASLTLLGMAAGAGFFIRRIRRR